MPESQNSKTGKLRSEPKAPGSLNICPCSHMNIHKHGCPRFVSGWDKADTNPRGSEARRCLLWRRMRCVLPGEQES